MNMKKMLAVFWSLMQLENEMNGISQIMKKSYETELPTLNS